MSHEFCGLRAVNGVFSLSDKSVPTLLLGGGGYSPTRAARLWTHLTAVAANKKLDGEIPSSDDYFLEYGPSYEFDVLARGRIPDLNTSEYLESVRRRVQGTYVYARRTGGQAKKFRF